MTGWSRVAAAPAAEGRLGLPPFIEALRTVHAPIDARRPPSAQLAAARRRRRASRSCSSPSWRLPAARARRAARRVRARPTEPRRAVCGGESALAVTVHAVAGARHRRDRARPGGAAPMQRLLVGDVGSGKTAVAFAAAAIVAAAGGQTLLMAPTEVLVDQHAAHAARRRRQRLGLAVGALHGVRCRAPSGRSAGDRCGSGRWSLLVGTQALLERRPRLRRASRWRSSTSSTASASPSARACAAPARRTGGRALPHLLVMSATPIPRTLALTLYGDLDAPSCANGPRGGRRPRPRSLPRRAARGGATDACGRRSRRGRQAYVVCPVRERRAGRGR